ncbi:MAG: DUF2442 domain-containing protein [Gammaproteobacteria bacterium]|nr:DUF2442 domain-containing protein [Gammaproteobacteria bacterium]
MRSQTDPTQDPAIGVIPTAPWRVAELRVLPAYRLWIKFIDGTEGTVDMSKRVTSKDAGVFAALRDENLFAQARIEYGVVTWPGELDLAPDAMHTEISQHGTWILH